MTKKKKKKKHRCPWCGSERPPVVDKMAFGDDWPRCPDCVGN